jgi:outer membrane protein
MTKRGRRMRKTWLLMTAAVMAISTASAQAETFGDALASAYKNSNLLEQNQAVLRAADEDVAVAMAALRPVLQFVSSTGYSHKQSISLFGGTSWSESFSESLQLNAQMTLYDFGRADAGIEVAKETVLATEQSLRNVEQQVLLAAVQAYVNVTLQTEMVAMQQSNVRLITKDLRATQDRFDVGEVTRTDVAQAESQLASAKAQLAASEGQLALAREAYKATVGHYPSSLSPLPRAPKLPRNLTEATAVALKTNPQILAAQHQSKAADLRVAQSKANLQPEIVGQAGLGRTYLDTGDSLDSIGASVTLSQTLYAGGQLSAFYRKSLNAQDSALAAVQQSGVTVAQGVGNAWANLSVAAASISAGDQQVAAAQAALDGVRQEAAVGSRTTLDVLNAEQALLNAKATRLQAVANLANGEYSVLFAMGLLTADHLGLGIPLYDPQAYYDAVKNGPATSAQGAKLDKILKLMGRD